MTASEAILGRGAADFIDGRWRPLAGDGVVTRNPARPDEVVWAGTPDAAHAEEAVDAARRALPAWIALGLDGRREALLRWREACVALLPRFADAIAREVGKVRWEAELEAKLLGDKVAITL